MPVFSGKAYGTTVSAVRHTVPQSEVVVVATIWAAKLAPVLPGRDKTSTCPSAVNCK